MHVYRNTSFGLILLSVFHFIDWQTECAGVGLSSLTGLLLQVKQRNTVILCIPFFVSRSLRSEKTFLMEQKQAKMAEMERSSLSVSSSYLYNAHTHTHGHCVNKISRVKCNTLLLYESRERRRGRRDGCSKRCRWGLVCLVLLSLPQRTPAWELGGGIEETKTLDQGESEDKVLAMQWHKISLHETIAIIQILIFWWASFCILHV